MHVSKNEDAVHGVDYAAWGLWFIPMQFTLLQVLPTNSAGVHSLQDTGHEFFMKLGFLSHSPLDAQSAQEASLSRHALLASARSGLRPSVRHV